MSPSLSLAELHLTLRQGTVYYCNSVFRITKAELLLKINSGEVRCQRDMPVPVLTTIIAGVKASPMISDDDKACL